MSRAILIPATLLLGVIGVTSMPALAADGERATYLGGSVISIPRYKEVMFDFADGQNLSLRYDKTAFSIPYAQITSMELGRSGWRGKRVKHVPIWFSKDSPAITIHFKNSQDVDQVMVLAISSRDSMSAVPILQARTGKEVLNAGLTNTDDGTWWGDRYWRTDRNAHTWVNGPQQTAAGAASTGTTAASATTSR